MHHRHGRHLVLFGLFGVIAVVSLMLTAALVWADGPTRPKSIFDDDAPPATPAKTGQPPATRPADQPPANAPSQDPSRVVADSMLVVADDFVTDIYQNGQRIPDSAYKLEGEIYGATVMRITLDVHPGDSLVFNVANDRFRWNGTRGLAVAGLVGDNQTPVFVSETHSGNWCGCDSVDQAAQFIKDPAFLHDKSAVVPERPWGGCEAQMKKRCDWSGETIWADGPNRNVWVRYVAPK